MADLAEERQCGRCRGSQRWIARRPVRGIRGRDVGPDLAEVEGADIYIGILGRRYGAVENEIFGDARRVSPG